MATQTVEFSAPPGQTITARLFAAGSDTVVQTASAVTGATNRAGVYSATFADVAAGLYRLIATNAGGTPLAQWWVDLTLATATFQAYEVPVSVMQSGLSTLDAAGVRSAVGLASADLDTQLADLPTVAEFEARTLLAAAYFDAATDPVTVSTNNDKTGYSLTAGTGLGNQTADITGSLSGSVGSISGVTFPTNFNALGINSSGHVSLVTLVDTTTTNTDMRGTDGAALASAWTATRAGYLDSVVLAANSNQRTVQITGSNHVAADIHEFQPDVITSAATDATFVSEVQNGLATSAALATVDGLIDLLVSRSGYQMSILAGAISNAQDAAEAYSITLDGSTYSVTYSGLDASGNRSGATLVTT